jgi:hypothetical protein
MLLLSESRWSADAAAGAAVLVKQQQAQVMWLWVTGKDHA